MEILHFFGKTGYVKLGLDDFWMVWVIEQSSFFIFFSYFFPRQVFDWMGLEFSYMTQMHVVQVESLRKRKRKSFALCWALMVSCHQHIDRKDVDLTDTKVLGVQCRSLQYIRIIFEHGRNSRKHCFLL